MFVVYSNKGKKKVTYIKNKVTRDSLYANRYNVNRYRLQNLDHIKKEIIV